MLMPTMYVLNGHNSDESVNISVSKRLMLVSLSSSLTLRIMLIGRARTREGRVEHGTSWDRNRKSSIIV